ncbi:hypothetical protein L596_024379 [Steinernema carpocapsae]|uniref:Uncharacterized protein n=1 Tax=Steinernema carpocapsae TaxID=34508 RepID=A0A4U5MGK5_STECR|nr:hypothetical protein L596_024379 [Steinernema carpocapsae]
MLRYAFATEKDYVFRRFSLCSIQVGVYAIFCLQLQVVSSLLQLRYICNAIFPGPLGPATQLPFAEAALAFEIVTLILMIFGFYGVLNIHAKSFVPVYFAAVLKLFVAILMTILAFLNTSESMARHLMVFGISYASLVPIHIFTVPLFFCFLRFAKAHALSLELDESRTMVALKFHMSRREPSKSK